jgi:hypothetical protein
MTDKSPNEMPPGILGEPMRRDSPWSGPVGISDEVRAQLPKLGPDIANRIRAVVARIPKPK